MLRESLARLLLSSPGPETDAPAGAIARAGDWEQCVRLANSWGALPRLQHWMEAAPTPPPVEARALASRLFTDGYVRSLLEARRGVEVLGRFQAASLPALAFKGLASLATLYSDPKQRVILDVDVLIGEADLTRAASLLGTLGFHPAVPCDLADYVRFVRSAPGFGGNEELPFHNARGNTIDLHWRLGDGFDPQEILVQSMPASLFGKEIPTVSPRYGLLLCVHHALRNHFSPDKIMRDLFDLELWCDKLNQAGSLDEAFDEAARRGLAAPLLAMAGILAEYDGGCAMCGAVARWRQRTAPRHLNAASQLRALFTLQLREGQMEREVLYLFRPGELRQILAGLFFGGRRHLEISRSMDDSLAGEPVPASRRLWTLLRALCRLRPRHLGMLRSLARAKDDFAHRA
ncbi:MAG: nucleotidyltransferase family protein [Acidobacteria bacterium]|nr:nucleotidyltransferase family protein [Acidobacteriota bacterium]